MSGIRLRCETSRTCCTGAASTLAFRRGLRELRYEASPQETGVEVPQETARSPQAGRSARHAISCFMRRSAQDAGCDHQARGWPLAEQPCREFAPAVSTTRAGDAPLPADATSTEICRGSQLDPQPLQPGTPPCQPRKLRSADLPFMERRAAALTAWRQLCAA